MYRKSWVSFQLASVLTTLSDFELHNVDGLYHFPSLADLLMLLAGNLPFQIFKDIIASGQ